MTGERYLIVVADDGAAASWRERVQRLARLYDFNLTVGRSFALLSSSKILRLREPGQIKGAIVGTMFARDDRMAVTELPEHEASLVLQTRGASLIQRYWGNYIAIIDHQSGPTVVRAPFGDLPCFVRRLATATILASDVALLQAVSGKLVVDWHAVGLQLVAPDIRRRQTCLVDVDELACGDSLTVGSALDHRTLWSPWQFSCVEQRCDNRLAAIERLRTALLDTVAAQTSDGASNVLLLSGGVDSSVVAAALSAAGRNTLALTMVTRDAGGDERSHARRVAGHCGMPLAEIVRDQRMVDITRSEASSLPYPTETSFSQATRAAAAELTGSSPCRVVHGGGGDQIFCSLQSAAPLADLIRAKGYDPRMPALALDLARVAHTTAGAVVRQALRRVITRRSDYRWQPNLECLTPMARAHQSEALHHSWLVPPAGTGSGTAGHVALAMSALGIVQSPARSAHPPWKAILLSQPVIEACLSTPPWLWYERGCNRAIARRAVENLLPGDHIWRPGKGAMASFMIEIFETNRERLRSMIGDGMLVREGLVDRETCLRILDDPPPIRGRDWARLLHFADVEAWAASR